MKRKLALLLLPVLILGLLAGCGGRAPYDSGGSAQMAPAAGRDSYGYTADEAAWGDWDMPAEPEEAPAPNAASIAEGSSPALNTKLIYRADMELQTTSYDEAVVALEALVKSLGGYFEDSQQYSYDADYRSAYYVVRVPVENFEALCQGAGSLCTQVYLNRSIQDVSESYYDTESRLAVAQTKYDRLLDLLSKADNMSDIIDLENALAETEYEIESLTGSLRHYDSLIGYSTVSISLEEVYRTDLENNAPMTFGQKLGQAFRLGMIRAKTGLENLVIFIVGHIVGIIVVIVIIAVVVWFLRFLHRRRQSRPPKPPKEKKPKKEKKRRRKADPVPVIPDPPADETNNT